MAEAFTARATTREQVENEITAVPFATDGGSYDVETLLHYINAVERILKGIYNPESPAKGVSDLLIKDSDLSQIQSSHHFTADRVLKARREAAAKKSGTSSTDDAISRADAQEIADRKNYAIQSILGAKEGIARAFAKAFGAPITDAVLKDSKGIPRDIDDYTIAQVIDAARANANRPTPDAVLDSLVEIVHYRFDFRQKFATNNEALRTRIANLRGLGITVDPTQHAFVLIANLEAATKEEWGRDFRSVLDDVRRKYPYQHIHDAASITVILALAAGADSIRDLRAAPAPDRAGASANSVAESVSYLNALLNDPTAYDTDTETIDERETANAVTSDSDTSVERRRPRRREHKRDKDKKSSRRGQSARRRQADNDDDDSDDEQRKKNLKCKHCKKFGRTKKHPGLSPSKCHWNTKYKGYRPRNVCDQLGIEFKPRIKFSPELGGFPKPSSDTEDSE